ncbi:Imm40 family immunity protein, partial [Neisseria meningitidis]
MLNEIFEIYSRQGESLIGIGIREAALPVPIAIDILNLFINERILVLGGDIYIKKDNYFYQTYDNWYYEGSNLFNSIDKAMHY